ncbi:MarR family winged helix-turn-helix transcriptional regulator [Nocardioides marmoraquaticus]
MSDPRWLDDDERDAWITLLKVATWLPQRLDGQLQRDAGVSLAEWQVLSWLSMAPERTARLSLLGSRASVSLSHLSRVVSRLERAGWVQRRPDPDDGRATLAVLTSAGWDKVFATAPGHVAEARRVVVDRLSREQVVQLREIGAALEGGLAPGC